MSAIFAYDLALAALGLLAGFGAGTFHFASLRRSVEALTTGGSARAELLPLARFTVTVATLVALALLGAAPLIAGFLGIMAARRIALRRAGDAP